MDFENIIPRFLKIPLHHLSLSLPPPSLSSSFMSTFMAVILVFLLAIVGPVQVLAASGFNPKDSIMIDCGATSLVNLPDNRIFKTDANSAGFLEAKDNIQLSVPASSAPKVPSPLYLTARVFASEAVYTFQLTSPGWHWVRLYFYPVNSTEHDLKSATFSVTTDSVVLLHSFSMANRNESDYVLKEYLLGITEPQLKLKFTPDSDSIAFINAIEVVSAPDDLLSDTATALYPVGQFKGISSHNYQYVYRLNVGGPLITSVNDTLGRTWENDAKYMRAVELGQNVSVPASIVKFPEEFPIYNAPRAVYATAVQMAEAGVSDPNFNVTWNFTVDTSFDYLLRLHFCDIVSKNLNDLYFNVYINEKMAISGLDLSTLTQALATPYYQDFVVNSTLMSDGLTVQIGPFGQNTGTVNAILNGLEVMKMSSSVDSLDGDYGVDGRSAGTTARSTVAAVGFAMMFGAFVGLGAMVIKWHKRPQDWQKRNSFSSWLLPVHSGDTSFTSSKSNFHSSTFGLGRYFSFAELQEATKNFDSNAVIGVGGFGNVYLGVIDDGTQVAVKRGNPQSEQGINEFQTEIQMLSKLRHRHLVSLIGYCDENNEMILVYEYMSKGPFRDHIYGTGEPPLSWKQRLEICIGAARGLHYLHTGTAQGIIHRDVKTTNILLDDNLVAKVADFGLSKDAPIGQGHVSTAVKGSFGYLDPEYFRRQQLTDKSDVYSFGVVMLEALCARPALNPQLPREQVNLAEWAMQCKKKGMLEKIIDPHLQGNINPESMKKFAEAAQKCLAEHGVDRPTMGDVLWNLEYALQLQEAFSQGKSEDEGKSSATIGGAAATPQPANPAEPRSEANNGPAETNEQSPNMFSQPLGGR